MHRRVMGIAACALDVSTRERMLVRANPTATSALVEPVMTLVAMNLAAMLVLGMATALEMGLVLYLTRFLFMSHLLGAAAPGVNLVSMCHLRFPYATTD
jgi:NO-binding membrane sensor protein with MHYT domain